jgi:hypothetical protein
LPWLWLSCNALDSGISGIAIAWIEVKQQLIAAGFQKKMFDTFKLANSLNVECLPESINNKSYSGIVHGEIASNCFPGGNIIPPSPDNPPMHLPMCRNILPSGALDIVPHRI